MNKTDIERLKKIVRLWEALDSEVKNRGLSKEQLMNDQFAQWAVTTPIYNIGEQVYQLSGEIKSKYPDVEWKVVAGLRHRLVHDYEGINWSLIAEVVFSEMEPFVGRIKQIIVGEKIE